MRLAPVIVLLVGCSRPAAVAQPVAAPKELEVPAATVEPPPRSILLSAVGAGGPADAPVLAVGEGARTFTTRRVTGGPTQRETWRLAEDGSRRLLFLVVEIEETPDTWKEIGRAGWAGTEGKGGAIDLRLVERAGALPWAPEHVEGTCTATRTCTEEKPALDRRGRRCDFASDETEGTAPVILAPPGVTGTISATCLVPKQDTVTARPMRGRMKRYSEF